MFINSILVSRDIAWQRGAARSRILGDQAGVTVERPERFHCDPFPSSVHRSSPVYRSGMKRFGEGVQLQVPP